MQIFINTKEVLSMQDAAKLAGVTVRWVSHLVETGKLQAVKHEKRRYVYKESLDDYMKNRDIDNL